ncbi:MULTISPECIES: hypothetical protein [Sphingobacterium]|uniref:hypothetical protein n=1 Tax=Sphingobacterium TaxID=28453 RepID=UPI00104E1AAC|nr:MULTISPECIES: hypothetical protein [Sphingobacterium]MCW2261023.1 hypothetical protein [Sphingobacterium kitahiroshimense]TCR08341.1 hypothetical protein EDF67_107130 [Sphingobacterium sp. JUb78]
MKKSKNYFFYVIMTIITFISIGYLVSCQDPADDLESLLSSESLNSVSSKDRATSFSACLESYDTWEWRVTYICPKDSTQLSINNNDIRRAKRIDSITKFNGSKYPVTSPVMSEETKKDGFDTSYPIHRYGTEINNIYDELASAPETATVTLYVLEYGPYGGMISLGIQNSSSSTQEYSRAVAFYPNQPAVIKGHLYNEKFFDTSGLVYSYSITVKDIFISKLLDHIAHRKNPNFRHKYSYKSFEGYHLFKEAFLMNGFFQMPSVAPPQYNYPHQLASVIRTWTPNSYHIVNREGGIIPARKGEGGSEFEL